MRATILSLGLMAAASAVASPLQPNAGKSQQQQQGQQQAEQFQQAAELLQGGGSDSASSGESKGSGLLGEGGFLGDITSGVADGVAGGLFGGSSGDEEDDDKKKRSHRAAEPEDQSTKIQEALTAQGKELSDQLTQYYTAEFAKSSDKVALLIQELIKKRASSATKERRDVVNIVDGALDAAETAFNTAKDIASYPETVGEVLYHEYDGYEHEHGKWDHEHEHGGYGHEHGHGGYGHEHDNWYDEDWEKYEEEAEYYKNKYDDKKKRDLPGLSSLDSIPGMDELTGVLASLTGMLGGEEEA